MIINRDLIASTLPWLYWLPGRRRLVDGDELSFNLIVVLVVVVWLLFMPHIMFDDDEVMWWLDVPVFVDDGISRVLVVVMMASETAIDTFLVF